MGDLSCSFCDKSQHNVTKMVVSGSAGICHECAELVTDIMCESLKAVGTPSQFLPRGLYAVSLPLDETLQQIDRRILESAAAALSAKSEQVSKYFLPIAHKAAKEALKENAPQSRPVLSAKAHASLGGDKPLTIALTLSKEEIDVLSPRALREAAQSEKFLKQLNAIFRQVAIDQIQRYSADLSTNLGVSPRQLYSYVAALKQ